MASASVTALRTALRARFPASHTLEAPRGILSTGVADLDAILPHGGLPKGRITEWIVARGGGGATLLRALVNETLRTGQAVAIVDAGRTLAAGDWVALAQRNTLTIVRPATPGDGPFCAELLLRTGAFGLVVLDGVGLGAQLGARLAHRAGEAGCALLLLRPSGCVWLGQGQGGASLRLRLAPRAAPPGDRAARARRARAPLSPVPVRPIIATLVKGGPHEEVTLRCASSETNRLCAYPRVPDRRGAARRGRTW